MDHIKHNLRAIGAGALQETSMRMKRWIWMAGLAIALTGRDVQAEEPFKPDADMIACYGDTLDVVIVNYGPKGEALGQTQFALPNPDTWLVTPDGEETVLEKLPCQTEPIRTSGFVGTFVEPRLGQATEMFTPPKNVMMWQLRVNWGSADDPVETFEQQQIDKALASGPVQIRDFLYQRWQNKPPYEGTWIFPKTYLSPVGTRIGGWCGSLCDVKYLVNPYVSIHYSFAMLGPDGQFIMGGETFKQIPPWIEVDQMVRSIVNSWIVE
jgi:hypothetical protein